MCGKTGYGIDGRPSERFGIFQTAFGLLYLCSGCQEKIFLILRR
ncbi:hypothetical protein HMPREF9120_00933 [Neisseria sp. oral taxon 020 str. F0370]|nr:hypothetical protein HMPREF9120_00933 [Neisseria sp. oral taxon 020 str. F0370]